MSDREFYVGVAGVYGFALAVFILIVLLPLLRR